MNEQNARLKAETKKVRQAAERLQGIMRQAGQRADSASGIDLQEAIDRLRRIERLG